MKTSPLVERWFAEKKPPTEATIRRVREIILGADRRMTEFVKYGTLTFGYDGDFATVVQVSDKKQASLMFNRGARIPGSSRTWKGRARVRVSCVSPTRWKPRSEPSN